MKQVKEGSRKRKAKDGAKKKSDAVVVLSDTEDNTNKKGQKHKLSSAAEVRKNQKTPTIKSKNKTETAKSVENTEENKEKEESANKKHKENKYFSGFFLSLTCFLSIIDNFLHCIMLIILNLCKKMNIYYLFISYFSLLNSFTFKLVILNI